jgi:hypothetical protein
VNLLSKVRRQPLTRSTALCCLLVNQLATPGLGSVYAGRVVSGAAQLVLAFAGFVLLVLWGAVFFFRLFRLQLDLPAPENSFGWAGRWGLISFGAAWGWAWLTSISLVLSVGRNPDPAKKPFDQAGPAE